MFLQKLREPPHSLRHRPSRRRPPQDYLLRPSGLTECVPPDARTSLETAHPLQYQPDPHLSRLMQIVRIKKEKRSRGVIAVLRENVPEDGLLDVTCQFVLMEDIRQRAQR